MSDGEAVVSLLHLTAVVAVWCAAYVGIDRADGDPGRRSAELQQLKKTVDSAVLLGVMDREGSFAKLIPKILRYFDTHDREDRRTIGLFYRVRAVVYAEQRRCVKLPVPHNICAAVYTAWYFPCITLFRSGFNLLVVGAFAATSLVLLFAIVGAILWQCHWISDPSLQQQIFMLLAVIAALVFFLSVIHAWILNSRRMVWVLTELGRKIDLRAEQVRDLLKKDTMAAVQTTIAAIQSMPPEQIELVKQALEGRKTGPDDCL